MKKVVFIVIVSLMTLSCPFYSYEDNTHQELTRKAIDIATKNGLPADFFKDTEKTAIINGSGQNKEGEDYTIYWITEEGTCDKRKKVHTFGGLIGQSETFNHFSSAVMWGSPASEKIVEFFNDAVELWKQGNKNDAAFILGRACHLVEDMTQPQHALDESHCPVWLFCALGLYNRSYLENFTEGHIVAHWPELCEYNSQVWDYANYTSLISQNSAYGCEDCTEYLSYFFNARQKGIEQGSPLENNFTLAQLWQWFPEQEIDIAAGSFNLPFQMPHECDDKTYGHGYQGTQYLFLEKGIL